MTPYLWLVFLPMFLACAWDALRDRTPREPRRPERVWWARKRTARERLDAHIRVK